MNQGRSNHHSGRNLTVAECLKKWQQVFVKPIFVPVGFQNAPSTISALKILNDFQKEVARDPEMLASESKIYAHGDDELRQLKDSIRSERRAKIIDVQGRIFVLLGHQFGKFPVLLGNQENMPISFENLDDATNHAKYHDYVVIS